MFCHLPLYSRWAALFYTMGPGPTVLALVRTFGKDMWGCADAFHTEHGCASAQPRMSLPNVRTRARTGPTA